MMTTLLIHRLMISQNRERESSEVDTRKNIHCKESIKYWLIVGWVQDPKRLNWPNPEELPQQLVPMVSEDDVFTTSFLSENTYFLFLTIIHSMKSPLRKEQSLEVQSKKFDRMPFFLLMVNWFRVPHRCLWFTINRNLCYQSWKMIRSTLISRGDILVKCCTLGMHVLVCLTRISLFLYV